MSELERALVALGRELEFPDEPDMVARLRGRLEQRGAAPRARLRVRPLAAALAAVLAVALAATLAVPDARSTFLRFLHLGGVAIVRVETLPPARERPLAEILGRSVPLAQVSEQTGIHPRLPPGERPAHGYVVGGVVSFVLSVDGVDVLLTEVGGGGDIVKKTAVVETTIARVDVAGDPGYWVTGKRHVVEITPTPPRLAGNVLVWQADGLGLRLEGPLSKEQALRIARSVR